MKKIHSEVSKLVVIGLSVVVGIFCTVKIKPKISQIATVGFIVLIYSAILAGYISAILAGWLAYIIACFCAEWKRVGPSKNNVWA